MPGPRTLPGTINVPGIGPVNFPASMSDDEVTAAAKQLHDRQSQQTAPSGLGDRIIGAAPPNEDPRATFGRNALNDAGNVASNLWNAAKNSAGWALNTMRPPVSQADMEAKSADTLGGLATAGKAVANVPRAILNTLQHPIQNFQQRPISTMLDASLVADGLGTLGNVAGKVADYAGAGLTRSAVGSDISDAALQAMRDTRAVPGTTQAAGKLSAVSGPLQEAATHQLQRAPAHTFAADAADLPTLQDLIHTERTGTAGGSANYDAALQRKSDFLGDPNISEQVNVSVPLSIEEYLDAARKHPEVPKTRTVQLTPEEIAAQVRPGVSYNDMAKTREVPLTKGQLGQAAEGIVPKSRMETRTNMRDVPMPVVQQTLDNLLANAGNTPAGRAAGANAQDLQAILQERAPIAVQLQQNAAPYLEAQRALETSPKLQRGLEFGAGARDVADSMVGAGLLFHMLNPLHAAEYLGLRGALKSPMLRGHAGQALYDASQALQTPAGLGPVQGAAILQDAMREKGVKDDWWSPRPQQP